MYQLLEIIFRAIYCGPFTCINSSNHFPRNIWSPIHMYQLLQIIFRAIYGRPFTCINSSKSFSVQYMVAKSYVSTPRNHFPCNIIMIAQSYVSIPRSRSPCNIWSPNLFYQLLVTILRAIYGRPFPCINSSKAFSVQYMVAHSHVSTPRNHSPCNIWSPKPMYQLLEVVLRAIYGRPFPCINSTKSFSVQYMVTKSNVSTPRNHSPCNIWSPNPMYQLLGIILRAIYGRRSLYINSLNLFSIQYIITQSSMLNLFYISTLAIFLCAS